METVGGDVEELVEGVDRELDVVDWTRGEEPPADLVLEVAELPLRVIIMFLGFSGMTLAKGDLDPSLDEGIWKRTGLAAEP